MFPTIQVIADEQEDDPYAVIPASPLLQEHLSGYPWSSQLPSVQPAKQWKNGLQMRSVTSVTVSPSHLLSGAGGPEHADQGHKERIHEGDKIGKRDRVRYGKILCRVWHFREENEGHR